MKRVSAAAFPLLLTLAASPTLAQEAEPALRLDPTKPVIDVPSEVTRQQLPAPEALSPASDPEHQVATTGNQPSNVSREELPPLPGSGEALVDVETATGTPIGRRADQGQSGFPADLWHGVSMQQFEQISRDYAVRPQSIAVRNLWVQIFRSNAQPPAGALNQASFDALRIEGLYRLGAFEDAVRLVKDVPPGEQHAILKILAAKSQIALGREDEACATSKGLISETGKVSVALQRDFVEISAYCAIRTGDMSRAGLMIEIARDGGIDAPETFAIIDAMTLSKTPRLPSGRRIGLISGNLAILGGHKPKSDFFDRATPALLSSLAYTDAIDDQVRLEAAEHAARRGVLTPSRLRNVYLASKNVSSASGERARLVSQIASMSGSGAGVGANLLRQARSLLDQSKTTRLYPVIAAMLGPDIDELGQTRETQPFAETVIEIALAAGAYDTAVSWAIFASSYDTAGRAVGSSDLMHWLMPIDVAAGAGSVPGNAGMVPTENLALQGRFSSDVLHRLVTILDGLGYTLPIPLWEAASQTPQPAKGYLPKTGVLAQLKTAASKGEIGHTLLMAIAALGPDGAGGAHLISLGDTLRALRTAGLEAQARQLAFEAVYSTWPRSIH